MPTLRRTADVRGGPRVDGALGVLGQGILPGPVKVVQLVLHEATDLLVLKAAGVICREGKRLVSHCFFKPPPLAPGLPGCLQQAARRCDASTAARRQAGARRAAPDLWVRLKRNISVIRMIMEGLIQADGCDGLTKWKKAIRAKEKERFCWEV